MTKPTDKKPDITFTGQAVIKVLNGKEYVCCPVCNDESDLVSTNGTAWFDGKLKKYVHRECLSVPR